MFGQSAAASTVSTMDWRYNSPLYTSMPAPYIWWEPSLLENWTAQPGGLYNFGTATRATVGTAVAYPVQASVWSPPGGGTAGYQINYTTDIETNNDPVQLIPANEFAGGVTAVAMFRANGDPSPGTAYVNIGVGGVGFTFFGLGGGNDYIAPTIIPQDNDLGYYTSGVAVTQPGATNYQCLIATFVPAGSLTALKIYRNGSLVAQGNLGYNYFSYAANADPQIWGGNQFFFGSILRFNYILNTEQISIVTNYMRTIWGTLG